MTDKDNTSLKPTSSEGEPSSAEAVEGRAPPLNRLVASRDQGSRSRTSPSAMPSGAAMPNGGIQQNSLVPPMESSVAALIQRHQEEQKNLQTRLLMQQQQQRPSDESSLVAAAMATASNNLMGSGQYPTHQDALLYQQALMDGRGGMRPPTGAPFAAGLGNATKSETSHAPPDMASPGSRLAPPKRKKTKKVTRGPAYDDDDDDGTSEFHASSKHRPYFDGSTHPDPSSSTEEDDEDSDDKDTPKTNKKNEPFPKKLYRMIEDAKKNGQEDIISFYPHGRAFGIHKPAQFVSEIMPKYLTTTRMSSFQRQLNLYSFRRITEGRDKGGYFHEFFLQGRKGLVKKIKRKRPAVPRATKEDLDTAARLSNQMLSTGNYVLPYGNTDTLQQMMMMDRASSMLTPQNVGAMGPSFGYGGPPPPNPALVRGQAYPPAAAPDGMADQGGLPYGYGSQPPSGYH